MTKLPPLSALSEIPRLANSLPGADTDAAAAARVRQNSLTKPPGSLGRLEELAEFMAAWRGTDRPEIWRAQALVFAGNHGICAQGVNPYPQEVTGQMVANFQAGGAAINQLCRANGAELSVIALDLDRPTADFTQGPAMTEAECLEALNRGAATVPPKHAAASAAAMVELPIPISPRISTSAPPSTAAAPRFRAARHSASVIAGPWVKSAVGRSRSSAITESSAPLARHNWLIAAPPA